MPTQEELLQMYSQVTILQKIVTLQHIHSLYLAAQQAQPPHRDISFNILQLQKMINNNPLINPDFDLLDINGSLNAIRLKKQSGNAAQQKNILNAIQIVQVIAETLSIETPDGHHEQPIQQVPKTTVFKLSNLIDANLVKDRLIKILNKYKNTTLDEITSLESSYKKKKNEIELIENGKVEDNVLYQEFIKGFKSDKMKPTTTIQPKSQQPQQQLRQTQIQTKPQTKANVPIPVKARFPTTAITPRPSIQQQQKPAIQMKSSGPAVDSKKESVKLEPTKVDTTRTPGVPIGSTAKEITKGLREINQSETEVTPSPQNNQPVSQPASTKEAESESLVSSRLSTDEIPELNQEPAEELSQTENSSAQATKPTAGSITKQLSEESPERVLQSRSTVQKAINAVMEEADSTPSTPSTIKTKDATQIKATDKGSSSEEEAPFGADTPQASIVTEEQKIAANQTLVVNVSDKSEGDIEASATDEMDIISEPIVVPEKQNESSSEDIQITGQTDVDNSNEDSEIGNESEINNNSRKLEAGSAAPPLPPPGSPPPLSPPPPPPPPTENQTSSDADVIEVIDDIDKENDRSDTWANSSTASSTSGVSKSSKDKHINKLVDKLKNKLANRVKDLGKENLQEETENEIVISDGQNNDTQTTKEEVDVEMKDVELEEQEETEALDKSENSIEKNVEYAKETEITEMVDPDIHTCEPETPKVSVPIPLNDKGIPAENGNSNEEYSEGVAEPIAKDKKKEFERKTIDTSDAEESIQFESEKLKKSEIEDIQEEVATNESEIVENEEDRKAVTTAMNEQLDEQEPLNSVKNADNPPEEFVEPSAPTPEPATPPSELDESINASKRKRKFSSVENSPGSPIHTNKKFRTVSIQLIKQISENKFSAMFLQPVNQDDEPEYYQLIKEPADLKSLIKDIKLGKIEDFEELEFKLQLMFSNAVMYNDVYQEETYQWTIEMMEEAMGLVKMYKETAMGES